MAHGRGGNGEWRNTPWRWVQAWCWDKVLSCAPGKTLKHHYWCPLTHWSIPKLPSTQIPKETGTYVHPWASPSLPVGSLGTLGCGWEPTAPNLCFPPQGSMSQIPAQKHRSGVQPQANNRGRIQPLQPDPSGRTAQERSCKDQGQRVCVAEAHLEVQVL